MVDLMAKELAGLPQWAREAYIAERARPPVREPPFKAGDIVRLKSGSSRQRVTGCEWRIPTWAYARSLAPQWCVIAEYLSSVGYPPSWRRSHPPSWRAATDYELVEPAHQNEAREQQEKTEMAKLYKTTIDGKEVFGTLLARDSAGNMVLEIKGTGAVVPVDPKNAEEVRPYTVAVRFFDSYKATPQEYHYEADKGAVKKNDVVLISDLVSPGSVSLAIVSRVNTKSDKATKRLNGFVLAASKIVGSAVDDGDEADETA